MKENGSKKVILLIVVIFGVLGILAALIIPQFMKEVGSNSKEPSQNPVGIILKQNEVTLDIGDSFDARAYIETAYDDQGKDIKDEVIVNEAINTSVESEYEVIYKLILDDEKIDQKTLTVFVKDLSK